MLIHASCVRFKDKGVLLLGKSGAGKSSATLKLIEKGAILVGDDYLELSAQDGKVIATCPKTTFGLLEVRGVGIIKKQALPQSEVNIVIECVNDLTQVPRMPEDASWVFEKVKLPYYKLCPFENLFDTKVELLLETV